MTNTQRDVWYFDILWAIIYDQDTKGPDLTNFILGKKIEATARIGAIAYGKVQDDYGVYLSAVLRARFEELASGDTKKSLEERKENYLTILLKIIEEKISRRNDPDVFGTIIDFLFNAPHAEIDLEEMGSWAYTSNSNAHEELLAAVLKARFKELVTGVAGAVLPTETKTHSDEGAVPRYREEVKDCKIEDFAIDSAQRDVLSASVSKLSLDGAFSKVTAQKLVDQGITTGLELFKTNREWIRENCNLNEKELQQIHELFFYAGLRITEVVKKSKIIKAMNDFLKTPITDLDLPVRLTGAITAYNAGRPIEEQYLTAEDIYRTSKSEFIKLRNIGKKRIKEISELLAKHNLYWS